MEAEEMKALQAQQAAEAAMASSDEDPDEAELADEIRAKRMIMKKASRREKGKNRPTLPRKAKRKPASEFAAHLESLGIRTDTAVKHQLPHTTQYPSTYNGADTHSIACCCCCCHRWITPLQTLASVGAV